MKLIDEMIQELIDVSQEWNVGEITSEERNLKLDLLINQVEQLQIQYENPLENFPIPVKNVFNSK